MSRSTAVALLPVLSLLCILPAQSTPFGAAPATWAMPGDRETGRVHVDVGDPLTIWARGDDWKASFAADGFRFVPFLGSDAPRNYPLHLRLVAASSGGQALPLELAHAPRRDGTRISIPRGSLTEVYELAPTEVEQLFVFEQPVRGGALTIAMRVATELDVVAAGDGGFRFHCELGGVRYGRAVAFDAADRSCPVDSRCEDGLLTLTVPAAFVAEATYPLTIDPLVSIFGISSGPNSPSRGSPDVAYVGSHLGLYAAVFEEAFSQTDHDVYLRPYRRDGTPEPGVYVDFTTEYWSKPQVASHRGASQFLVVAARGVPTFTTAVWGRTVDYWVSSGATVIYPNPQFLITTFGNGIRPDVGGDPNPSPPLPGNYCVTWETNGELNYRIVRTDGSMQTIQWVDPGPEFLSNARISKSCGVGPYSTQEWIIVWQKQYSPTDEDIYGSVVAVDGTLRMYQFLIDYSSYSDTNPEVSSKTDLIDGYERFLVTYERRYPGTALQPARSGLVGNLLTGTTSLTGGINLSLLLQASSLRNQVQPCVDTDGSRFAIGYSEWSALTGQATAPYLATVHVTNNALGVTSFPELSNGYDGPDDDLQITSERSGGSFSPRYLTAWTTTSLIGGSNGVTGAFYYGHLNLPPSSYFNNALPGCGALALTASGLPALGNTFVLQLTNAQGLAFLLLGASVPPVPLCPSCQLGIDQSSMKALFATSHAITVPTTSGLIGYRIGAQGLDLLVPGACSSPAPFSLSNQIIVTIL